MTISTLEDWQRVAFNQPQLLSLAEACDAKDVSQVSKLRAKYDRQLLHLALDLTAARRKGAIKFPHRAATLIADTVGLEQASSMMVGLHKAKRIKQQSQSITDLCCGIGGDAMAMSASGIDVLGVDISPIKTWMTKQNAHCPVLCKDVRDLDLAKNDWHFDPARRGQTSRVWNFEDYIPGPDFLKKLLNAHPHGCLKLGPGVSLSVLDAFFQATGLPYEIEMIFEKHHLTQALVWTGKFAQHHRRTATRLMEDGQAQQISGQQDYPPIANIQSYLYAINPAAERLRLEHLLCQKHHLASIHYDLGLLTSDRLIDDPFLTGFKFLEMLPWKQNTKNLRKWLNAHDCKTVEVKTRDKLCNPDKVQQQLRGKKTNSQIYTLFIHRWGEKQRVIITQRLAQ